MASNWSDYNVWGERPACDIWIQHRHPECMETEAFIWPTFQQLADWVQFHECGAQV
jgi:hypothetical protein